MNKWRLYPIMALLLALLILASLIIPAIFDVRSVTSAWLDSPQRAAEAVSFEGAYEGSVTLNGVVSGVYSDTTTPTNMDLGTIDLALLLTQEDDAISGYVNIERSLVFTQEHTIQATPVALPEPGEPAPGPQPLAVGPSVQGTFDGVTLRLVSESFSQIYAESRTLPGDGPALPEREIIRQFILTSTMVLDDGATLIGNYRETIWGYAPEPSTVVGTFSLQRPVFAALIQEDTATPTPTTTATTVAEATGTPTVTPTPPVDSDNTLHLPSIDGK